MKKRNLENCDLFFNFVLEIVQPLLEMEKYHQKQRL